MMLKKEKLALIFPFFKLSLHAKLIRLKIIIKPAISLIKNSPCKSRGLLECSKKAGKNHVQFISNPRSV
jgi:hypothetical protein